MAIPGPGSPLAVTDIVTEFGGTAPHGLSEYYRGGGLVPDAPSNTSIPTSGAIGIGNFYGSANRTNLSLTITSNTNSYNLYTQVSSNPAYIAGATDVTLTINPGVTVGGSTPSSYALSVPSSFSPGDGITIVNNGTIIGKGGNGGAGGIHGGQPGTVRSGTVGTAGGHALLLERPASITNAGVMSGGGGGGGGGGATIRITGYSPKNGAPNYGDYHGPGGGGGAGAPVGTGGLGGNTPTAVPAPNGSNGTATTGGAGGPAVPSPTANPRTGIGGTGGNRGNNGSASTDDINAPSQPQSSPVAGGATGRYITGNTYATWVANGTRLGGSS